MLKLPQLSKDYTGITSHMVLGDWVVPG